jgi:hypothetical protein
MSIADERRKLGTRVEAFKKVAPTRPHLERAEQPAPAHPAGFGGIPV